MIKDWTTFDLDTLDKFIHLGQTILGKVDSLAVSEDAKVHWRHEVTASVERLREMRPSYEDGAKTVKTHKDRAILMMHMQLCQQFTGLYQKANPPHDSGNAGDPDS